MSIILASVTRNSRSDSSLFLPTSFIGGKRSVSLRNCLCHSGRSCLHDDPWGNSHLPRGLRTWATTVGYACELMDWSSPCVVTVFLKDALAIQQAKQPLVNGSVIIIELLGQSSCHRRDILLEIFSTRINFR